MPWPRSGSFGQAYHVLVNGRQWGVKCFTRLHDDQEARYRAISAHLRSANLPYMVDFDFQPAGMRVKGKTYPLLKMAWIDGEPLDDHIEKHLTQSAALTRLADKWLALVANLHAHGIAHGDLQHGNILVAGDELRLIDYDGMFVPALRGQASHEIGHRNYQHPLRNEQQFDDSLDRFSAWVIYLSLIALSIEPGLWRQFDGGDEKLLFDADDFRAPGRSPVLQALRDSRKPGLRPLAAFISELARVPPTHVQPLDGQLVMRALEEARAAARVAWINDHAQTAPVSRAASAVSPQLAAAPARADLPLNAKDLQCPDAEIFGQKLITGVCWACLFPVYLSGFKIFDGRGGRPAGGGEGTGDDHREGQPGMGAARHRPGGHGLPAAGHGLRGLRGVPGVRAVPRTPHRPGGLRRRHPAKPGRCGRGCSFRSSARSPARAGRSIA